ncbi:unnamed protein product [Amoebophrya sp. A120]|nr:unnamed protein product [Amoebophrya sp. A120]|eukprot:GSA120T00022689001.1
MDEVEEEDDTFEARRGGWFGVIFSLLIVVGVQVAMLMFVLTRPEGSTQVELGSTGGAKADDDLEVALLNEEEEEEEEQAEIS